MYNYFKQILAIILVISLLGTGIPLNLVNSNKVSAETVISQDLSDTQAGTVSDISADQAGSINTDLKESVFGPHRGIDETKKHAYEPFRKQKDDEKKEELANNAKYEKNSLLIKMKETINATTSETSSSQILTSKSFSILAPDITSNFPQEGTPFAAQGVISMEPMPVVSPAKISAPIRFSLQGVVSEKEQWYKATLQDGTDVISVANAIKDQPNVISAEPDYVRSTMTVGLPDVSTDERIDEQWYLNNSGVKQAWEYLDQQGINPGGSRDVVVAVIDTGVDYNHPDLAGNMWVNTGEVPGNGVDDDNNGYIDDINGACTVGNSWAGESGDPMDDHGHGTHVAGIIAGQAHNGTGIAGVAYNVQIMAIKAGQSSGVFTSSDIVQAINYAVEKGADVINMSYGGYGRSILEEDALSVAFGTSVLVAAAGNDNMPNGPEAGLPFKPMYPASYNWVLGVMAQSQQPSANGDNLASFSNWDTSFQNSDEYELMAPGQEILSTLPDGKYAKWSGTSMAAPVISGMAALLRSKFSNKDTYSSRFIMGQLVSTGEMVQGKTYNPYKQPMFYHMANAFNALTKVPEPNVNYLEHYIFDKRDLNPINNQDGIVDAGETIDIAMVVRNHWGKADNVNITIDTKSPAGIDDPYTTLLTETVNFGAIGNFGTDDNGLIYTNDAITGVNVPFKIQISPDTPNDHIIPIKVNISCINGFDPENGKTYETSAYFNIVVRRGVIVPGVISSDMTLTKDKYWIVSNSVVVEKNATLTIEPGTQVQFWSSQPEDPYAEKAMAYIWVKGTLNATGTAQDPIEMFASGLYPGYEVKIYSTASLSRYNMDSYVGNAEIKYAKIMNPTIAVQTIDHCYFSQDLFYQIFKRELFSGTVSTLDNLGVIVYSNIISNSIFYKLGSRYNSYQYQLKVYGESKGNLFDSCNYYMDEQFAEDNVYLKNFKLDKAQFGNREYIVSSGNSFGSIYNIDNTLVSVFPTKWNENGSTYLIVNPNIDGSPKKIMDTVQEYAKKFGGYIAVINDAQENEFLSKYCYEHHYGAARIGLNYIKETEKLKWYNGDDLSYTNWGNGYPINISTYYNTVILSGSNGLWYNFSYSNGEPYIIEIPGVSKVTSISLSSNVMTLGAGGEPASLGATILPAKASDKSIVWSSDNTDVATVDSNGKVTPLSVGGANITATTNDGGFTSNCTVNVIEIVLPTSVTISKESLRLTVGGTDKLVANVLPANSTEKNVIWSSSNPEIATVDNQGNINAIYEGTTTINVTTTSGVFIATCIVKVVQPATGISLDTNFKICVIGDDPIQLNANVLPASATDKSVQWQSSNEIIATVDSSGLVTPISKGTAIITATTLDGGFVAECTVACWDEAVNFVTKKISASSSHTLALNEDGSVWSFGFNGNGQLGDGTYNNRTTPVKVLNLNNVVDIESSGYSYSLALKNDGTVWGWGYSNYLAGGLSPNKVNGLSEILSISAGYDHTLALKSDGTVWSFGDNSHGQLGDGTNISRYTPIQVQNLTDVVAISTGYSYSLALKSDGTLWSWGYNYCGKLGNGNTNDSWIPVKVEGLSSVKSISAGASYSIALGIDGKVWSWGNNYYGQLGIGNTNNSLIPVQTQGLPYIKEISAGALHSVALGIDGSVWSWGYNEIGQLGDGTTISRSLPTKIIGSENSISINCGNDSSFYIKSDGSSYGFGNNNFGELGNFSTTYKLLPTKVQFGLIPDNTAPVIKSTTPIDNATDVLPNSKIVINFDEAIKGSDNYVLISLKDQNNNTVSLRSKSIKSNTITIEPLNAMISGMSYTLYIPGNSVKDYFGNTFYYEGMYLSFKIADAPPLVASVRTINNTDSFVPLSLNTRPQILANIAPISNLPDVEITQAFVDSVRLDFIYNTSALSTVFNNAILNCWWDPDVNHWMRFTSTDNSTNKRFISGNYWGTTNDILIEKALIHYNDFRNMEEIIYKPFLTTAPESAYPFVTDVYVSTQTEERASRVGAEKLTVNVLFNRDMDMSVQPQVSFGPDMPTTDYTVHGVNGGWITPRHWVGDFTTTAITGDGYQFFRVAGAVASDDPWLVTGNDSERFRFEIITSGTESMNLQAVGDEGKISLSWAQDDFALLAGFNLYRSNESNGTYTKINSSLIPSGEKFYEDFNVNPGINYYYKFTVVKTDFTESDFSNIASAAPIDTVAPVMSHTPINAAAVGLSLQIYADVTDNVTVKNVSIFYKGKSDLFYNERVMVKTNNNRYSATLEGSLIQAPGISYYIEATDGISIVRNGNPINPNNIIIADAPKINSVSPSSGLESGGTVVTITGTNFKQGASVLFGQSICTSVVVLDANHITLIAPSHYPATVDVCVINPDGYRDTYLGGFVYKSEAVDIFLPDISANRGRMVSLPVNITGVTGLRAAEIKFKYDSGLLLVKGIRKGTMTSNFALQTNSSVPGEITISMASATAVSGTGSLAEIDFEVLNNLTSSSALTFESVNLNDGSILPHMINGTFTVSSTYSVSGNATYFNSGLAVGDVNYWLKGELTYNNTSGNNGAYLIEGIESGNYSLTATKSNDINGITSYDASLILQHNVGLINLTGYQAIAGDVNNSGLINSMDAAYVLEKAVDLINLPFPGAGSVWKFAPQKIDYTNLSSNFTNQNFVAILLGDVSGNWSNEAVIAARSLSSDNIPDSVSVIPDADFVDIPLNINLVNAQGIDLKVSYDKLLVSSIEFISDSKLNEWSLAENPGDSSLTIGIAGSSALDLSSIGVLRVKVPLGFLTPVSITIDSIMSNEMQVLTNKSISISKQFEVSFNTQGGSNISEVAADYNSSINTPTTPTRTGYTFGGWYKESNCANSWNFSTDKVLEDVTLFAKWTINSYTVSFNTLGGSTINSISSVFNTVIATPNTPTRTGFTFGGWYKESNCVNSWNFGTDKVLGDVTLFAKWTINSYSVSFNAMGGAAVASKTATYNNIVTAPTNPIRSGFTFIGWYTSSALTTPFSFDTLITANTTLYAKWIASTTTGLKAASAGYNSIKLTWTAVSGATNYEIYRATSATGTYTLVATTLATAGSAYTNTGLSFNTTYYYKVRAYSLYGSVKTYSGYSTVTSAKTLPLAPASVVASSPTYNSIKLSWAATPGANGYSIYRSTSATGTFTLLTNVTSVYYTNISLTPGATYYYKISAYRLVGTTKVYGPQCAAISKRVVPPTITTFTAVRYSSTSIKLTWSAISGASGYEIYRSTALSGTYTLLKSQTVLTYTNTALKTGTTYYYKVRSYRLVGTTKVYSDFSSIKSAKP